MNPCPHNRTHLVIVCDLTDDRTKVEPDRTTATTCDRCGWWFGPITEESQ